LRLCADARRHADVSRHPFSEAMAQTISLRVHQLRGETAIVADQANAAITLCEEHEFVHYLAMSRILRGWARAQQGDFEEGIAEIQEGLDKERAIGALLFEAYSLGLLADACVKNKRYVQALEFVQQVNLDEENTEHFYAAEIHRLLGETYLRSTKNLDKAGHYFSKGLRIARKQKAKLLELRLCLSICDLSDLTENSGTCRSQLAETYRFFSEGFDTADLVRARVRLENS